MSCCRLLKLGLLVLSSVSILSGCGKKEEEDNKVNNKKILNVTLNVDSVTSTKKEDQLTFTIGVKYGDTISKALEYNEMVNAKEKYDKILNYSSGEFQGWFKDSESAYDLNKENAFDLDSFIVKEDLNIYAGFVFSDYTEALKQSITTYLGNFMSLGYSTLPFVSTSEMPTISKDYKELTFKHIQKEGYDNFKSDLLRKYKFKEVSKNTYLDKLKAYNVTLNYDESNKVLKLSYAFNDEQNKFPSNFVTSQFFVQDVRSVLNENYLYAVDFSKTKNFYTNYLYKNGTYYKTFSYVPTDAENAVNDFYDCLEANNLATPETDANGNYSYAVDETYSTLIQAEYSENMVTVLLASLYTTTLNLTDVKDSYKNVTGYNYDENLFPTFTSGKGYGSILAGYIGDNAVCGYYVSVSSKEDLDKYVDSLVKLGYQGEYVDYGDYGRYNYSYDYNLLNVTIEYVKKTNSYWSGYALICYSHPGNILNNVENWIEKQSKGKSDIKTIPLINGKGSYSSGYLTNNNSTMAYTYYMSVNKSVTTKEEYASELEKTNLWVKDSENSTKDVSIYVSKDQFFKIYISYDEDELVIKLLYNNYITELKSASVSDIYNYLKFRFNFGDDFKIPGLDQLVKGDKDVIAEEYFDSTYDRGLILIPTKSFGADSYYNSVLEEALNKSEDYSYIGTNSDESIKFYQDTKTGVIVYHTSTSYSSSYYLVGLYK